MNMIDSIVAQTQSAVSGAAFPFRLLGELQVPAGDDPNELLKSRFLCRGGTLLLVGPTGLGKSSFVMQAAITWTTGAAFLGVCPPRPLRIWLVQGENDQGDLAEQRDGVIAGLRHAGMLSDVELEQARSSIRVYTEDTKTGAAFGAFLEGILPSAGAEDLPDLLIIDPAFAYLGGDALSQRDVTQFCRNVLNPILHGRNVGLLLVHHTNKPANLKERNIEYNAGELAYLGAGSAEWANWARAVLAIRSLPDATGLFELHAAKRGRRLRWAGADGQPTLRKFIAHGRGGGIYWREPDASEIPAEVEQRMTKPARPSLAQVVEIMTAVVTGRPMPLATFKLEIKEKHGVTKNRLEGALQQALSDGKLLKRRVLSHGRRYDVVGLPSDMEKSAGTN